MKKHKKKNNYHENQNKSKQKRKHVRLKQCLESEHRENLEKKWFYRIEFAKEFAHLVVNSSAEKESFHRWLPYRQGFAPELIRKFISSAERQGGPILDPFCGSGTTLIECAKQKVTAVGVEALASLAFITHNCLNSFQFPDIDMKCAVDDIESIFNNAENSLIKTASLITLTHSFSGSGKKIKTDFSPSDTFVEKAKMINDDKKVNIAGYSRIIQGDARNLPFNENTFGGIVTSPPYLSKYDYTRVNGAIENLYQSKNAKEIQLKAYHRSYKSKWTEHTHPATAEASRKLKDKGNKKAAGIVISYFNELNSVIRESARVLKNNSPLTIVIAGSLFNGVYIPSDLIAAEICEENGLNVEEILSVRNFGAGKKLGNLDNISPREVILSARKFH